MMKMGCDTLAVLLTVILAAVFFSGKVAMSWWVVCVPLLLLGLFYAVSTVTVVIGLYLLGRMVD